VVGVAVAVDDADDEEDEMIIAGGGGHTEVVAPIRSRGKTVLRHSFFAHWWWWPTVFLILLHLAATHFARWMMLQWWMLLALLSSTGNFWGPMLYLIELHLQGNGHFWDGSITPSASCTLLNKSCWLLLEGCEGGLGGLCRRILLILLRNKGKQFRLTFDVWALQFGERFC